MIDDDATPEELDAWYRRSPQDIQAAKDAKWNADWQALRMPDDQAYEMADEPAAPQAAETGEAVDAAAALPPGWTRINGRLTAPTVDTLKPHQRALNDAINSVEAPTYDTVRASGKRSLLPRAADGQPDYSHYPSFDGVEPKYVHVGRAQISGETWGDVAGRHADVVHITPPEQDRAQWYLASENYRHETGGRDLDKDAQDPANYPLIVKSLRTTWPSLPGGEQQGQTQAQFNQRMLDGRRKYTPRDFDPSS